MTEQATTNFGKLEERYEIIGELGGSRNGRMYMARRRDDRRDVLISVWQTPAGDEGNALSHLASDSKRLAGTGHRNVVPVLDSEWLGTDALAVVTERMRHPTLAELLIRRDEEFGFPRVATVLREVNATLEWARSERLVHRALDPDGILVEPGSDRVVVRFTPRALPLAEMPGPDSDARTIAALARAMLTRSVADPDRDRLPLNELRPGLPDRLVERTEALRTLARGAPVPDVSEYIATVAMAEALKRGETEWEETTRKLLEEERKAREKIEAERLATEKAAAEQARLFQLEREEFARERDKILQELQKGREALARERAALAKERAEHEQDRATLRAEREEHRRWADEMEKAFAAQSEEVARQAAELARQSEQFAQTAELASPPLSADADAAAAPSTAPPVRPARPSRSTHGVTPPAMALPERPKPRRVRPEWMRAVSRAWDRRPHINLGRHWNRRWNRPLAAVVALMLVAVSAMAIARGRGGDDSAPRLAAGAPVVDSVAGTVDTASSGATTRSAVGIPADFVQRYGGNAQPGVPADLISGVRARRETARESAPASFERSSRSAPATPVPASAPAREPANQNLTTSPVTSDPTVPLPPVDSVRSGVPAPVLPFTRSQTAPRDTSVTPSRPDTARPPVRRDTTARRDTTVRGDTLSPAPSLP